MPRKTPIKELINEETTVSSPLRRSSRISNNSPAPTKVTTRRSSATETSSTSTPKATKGRRASFSQELEAKNENEMEAKNSKVSSTPRTRRGSFSSKTSENSVSEEEAGITKRTTRGSSVSKEQSADVKKPTTRRRRSVSQEVEIPEEAPTPKATRSRSSSITKKNEKAENEKSEENSTEESEALNSEVANIMAKSSSTETINKTEAMEEVNKESSTKDELKVGTVKKKKTDKLKVDLDLSVINETSLTEDDIISSEERKSPLNHEETTNEVKLENASEVKSSEITSSSVEQTVKDATSKNSTATEITTEKSVETEDSSSTTEKPEVNNELKSSSALEENAPKKENGIMETSDSPTSDGSFNLHLSSSVLESTNKNETSENTSPLSNKENIRPSDKPAEPMDVDEPDFENSSFGNLSKIQSPLPASPKSRTAAIISKELRIAEKVADEIDQFLKEETKFESSSKSKRSRLSLKSSSDKEKNTSENEIAVTEESVKQDKQSLVLNTEQQLQQNEETTVNENGEIDNISKKEEKSSPSSEEVIKETIPTSVFEEVYEKKEDVAVPVEEESDESIHLEITDDSLADPKIAETTKESIQENVEVEVVVSKEETEKVTKEDMQVTDENTPVVESVSSDSDKLEENTKEVFQKESLKETGKTQNEDDGHLEESTEINVDMNETINDTQTKIDESSTFEKTDSEISQNKDQHSLEETEPEDEIPQLVPVTSSGEERVKETEELLQSESLNKETTVRLDESSHGNTETDKKDITEDSPPKEKNVDVLNSSPQELKSDKDLAEDAENKEEIVEKSVSVSLEIEKESVENNQTLKKSPQIIIKSDILIQPSICKEVTESTSPSTKEVINETSTESKDEVNRTTDLNQEECDVDSFIEKEYKSPQKKIRAKSQIVIDCTNSSSEEEEDVVNEHKRKSIDQDDVTDSKYEIVENIKGRIEIIKVEENTPESSDVVVLSDNEKEAEIVDNKAVEEIDEKEILVSSDNENDVKEVPMIEAAKVADSSTMSQKKRSLDKTSIVMQGNIKAGEDKERRLSDRIHKVVDLFCAGIKNNSDVAVNVSLEYTGHFSDSDSEALPKKDTVEVTLTAEDQKQTSNLKGSKRRKLYNPEEEDVLVQSLVDQDQEMDSLHTEKKNKNETSTQINNKKKKKKKSATFSESDISIPSPQTSKRSPSAKLEGEEFTSPVKKQRMYKDTPYKSAKSNKKLVINNKEDKEERKKNQNRESENDDKSTNRKSDSSEEDSEQEDREENKKNDQKSTEWKPFSKYFSSMSESESEDDNDTTWGPSREIDMDDTVLSSEEEEAEEEEDSTSDILEEEEDASDVPEEEEESPALIIRSPIQHIMRKESKSKQSGSTSEDNAEMSFTCTMKKSDLFSSSSSESDVFNSTTISKKSPSPNKGNKKLIQSQIVKVEEVTVEEKKKQKKKDVEEKMNNDKQKEENKVTSKENRKPSPIKSTKEELTASEKKPKKRRHPTYVVSEEEAVVVKKPSLVSQKIPKVVVSEIPSSKLQVSKKECQKTIHSKQSSKKSGKTAKTTYLKPSTTMSSSEWDVKILP